MLTIKYWLEYIILRALIEFVRLFPIDMSVRLSARGWRLLAPYGRRHRRALDNLTLAYPEKTEEERRAIALGMWENLGRVMAETMLLDRLFKEPHRVEVMNAHILERYRGKMGAAICLSLHTGNWELTMLPFARSGVKTAAVYRLVKNPLVDHYLRSKRADLYPDGLFAKGKARGILAGHDTARMVGSYVRQGGRLGFLADLYDKNGLEVPFFGHLARSTQFPAMLARRLGARMWIGRSIRIGKECRFRVEIKELKVPRTDSSEDDIKEITAAIQSQFESWIREVPEQWMWSNRKWS